MVLLLASRAICNAGGNEPLTIGVGEWTGSSVIGVGIDQRFWEEEGLDVRVAVFGDDALELAALRSGKIDFLLTVGGNVPSLIREGIPLIVLGEVAWSDGAHKLLASPQFSFTQRDSVVRVGIASSRPPLRQFVSAIMDRNGVGERNVIFEMHGQDDLVQRFVDRRLSLIALPDPRARIAEERGFAQVLATSASTEGVLPEVLACTPTALERLGENGIRAFIRGWLRGLDWMNESGNFSTVATATNRLIFVDDAYSETEITAMLGAVKLHDRPALLSRNLPAGGLAQYYDRLRTFLEKEGSDEARFEPKNFLRTGILIDELKTESAIRETGG